MKKRAMKMVWSFVVQNIFSGAAFWSLPAGGEGDALEQQRHGQDRDDDDHQMREEQGPQIDTALGLDAGGFHIESQHGKQQDDGG